MKLLRAVTLIVAVLAAGPALAQAGLGESAKELLGPWEFSNADRDKTCTATFKSDKTPVGWKVEFDANCSTLFPLVSRVAGWKLPEGDNLFLMDAEGKTLVEFSEVESGIYEAPTPGVGVLFLQAPQAAGGGAAAKTSEQVAGAWSISRGGKSLCKLTLANTVLRDGFALTVLPGCDAEFTRLNITQWQLDRGELVLVPARGNALRFQEVEGGNWRRVPESATETLLVRQ
ncbi:MAG: AprI/Inh family metalloprotease inhibitor [Pseudolabrys sp.]|nr:AprI/Inh family metalloprotease inhibitor [Pseudolabrys sp.]